MCCSSCDGVWFDLNRWMSNVFFCYSCKINNFHHSATWYSHTGMKAINISLSSSLTNAGEMHEGHAMTLICHLSNAIMRWPNCPPPPRWGQLLGSVPTMTKESDVEAEGILYFNYLFGPFVVFPFTAQIQCQRNKRPCWHWPSDHQTHAAANLTVRTRVTDDGPGPLCTLTLTLNFVAFRGEKNTKKTDVFYFLWENLVQGSTDTVDLPSPMPRLVYKEELGLQSNGSPRSRNSWPRDDELRGENYWPLRWIVTFVWGAAGCSAGWLDCWHPWPMATFV